MFCHEAVPGEKLHLQEQTQNHSIGLKLCSVGNWLRYSQVPRPWATQSEALTKAPMTASAI